MGLRIMLVQYLVLHNIAKELSNVMGMEAHQKSLNTISNFVQTNGWPPYP